MPTKGDSYQECQCPHCGGKKVPRSAWFRHNKGKRPRLTGPGPAANSLWHAPGAAGPSQAPPVASSDVNAELEAAIGENDESTGSSTSSTSDSDSNNGVWLPSGDLSDEESSENDYSATSEDVSGRIAHPIFQSTAAANGVLVPVENFIGKIKDLAYFNYREEFRVSVKGATKMLKQRSDLISRTPATHDSLVRGVVHLHTTSVDACVNGFLAFTALRATSDVCDVCQASRRNSNGRPRKQVTYWSLIPWLVSLLLSPETAKEMVATMAAARVDASKNTQEITAVGDWYHGSVFRKMVQQGHFTANTDIALSVSTDGFEAWRQQGFQSWPFVFTVLNFAPARRYKIASQWIACITPGPSQPVDLESFMHPLWEELNQLSEGIPGVRVSGVPGQVVLRAELLQVTTDMPAGNKQLSTTGSNGLTPNRFRDFNGVRHVTTYYYPLVHPTSGAGFFSVSRPSDDRWSSAKFFADAVKVERTRAGSGPRYAVDDMVKNCGIKGYSLLVCPSPDDQARYPHLKYLQQIGPDIAPYDTMHLTLSNDVPKMWELVTAAWTAPGSADDDYVLGPEVISSIGREMRLSRSTIPSSQSRSLRNIKVHHMSFKAADWMYFIFSIAEAVFAGRLPEHHFKMIMSLSKACRIIFRPSPLSKSNITVARGHFRDFCTAFYGNVYAGRFDRLPFCRLPFATLLDVTCNILSCGPAWASWQFPVERAIGTLAPTIGSSSKPHESLTSAITRKKEAQLLSTFGDIYCQSHWRRATGEKQGGFGAAPKGSLAIPTDEDEQIRLMRPSGPTGQLDGHELTRMQTAVKLDGVSPVPLAILAKKYFRVQLAGGVIGGSVSTNGPGRRQNNLLKIDSEDLHETRTGAVRRVAVTTYGLAHHYAVVHIGEPRAFAYVECVRSAADRQGKYGLPKNRLNMHCFSSIDGRLKYVPLLAVRGVVGTLFRDGRHFVLFSREPFSAS